MDAKKAIGAGFRISETLVGMYLGGFDGWGVVGAGGGGNGESYCVAVGAFDQCTEQMAMGRIAPGRCLSRRCRRDGRRGMWAWDGGE